MKYQINKKRDFLAGLAGVLQLTIIPILVIFLEHQNFVNHLSKRINVIEQTVGYYTYFEKNRENRYFNCSKYPIIEREYIKPEENVQPDLIYQQYRKPIKLDGRGPFNFYSLYQMGFSWIKNIFVDINLVFNNGYLKATREIDFFYKKQIDALSRYKELCEEKMGQLEELPSSDNPMDVFLDNKYFFDFVVEERKLLQRDLPKIVSIYENIRIYNYVIGLMVLANVIGLVWGYRCIFQIIEEKYGFKKKLDGKKIDIFISIFLALVFFIIVSMFLERR